MNGAKLAAYRAGIAERADRVEAGRVRIDPGLSFGMTGEMIGDFIFDVLAQRRRSPNRRGNKMARERMTILYDISAVEDALVLGTSNKSELLLGYSTLWGDMASALNPLGDLYKTHVYQLSDHLGLPESITAKKPSADLWEGQTDEDELGFSYYDVDRVDRLGT